MPLSADFEYELAGEEDNFQTGLTALSRIASTYLGVSEEQTSQALTNAKNVAVTIYEGPCPAGNVGVQVNHIAPVNKGEVVWTINPTTVLYIGRLFNKGIVDLHHLVAVAGSEVNEPAYTEVLVGQSIKSVLEGHLAQTEHIRIINGNPLTGRKTSMEGFVGAHTSEITVIPEGDNVDEMLGWIMPRTQQFSVNHSYLSWLYYLRSLIKHLFHGTSTLFWEELRGSHR